MNKKKRYLRTFLALLLLAACMAAAVLAPEAVSDWYDSQTLGQVAYADITYEPYQITYYDTFEEKLDAIAQVMAHGYIYRLDMGERNDLIKDDGLLEIVNEEMEEMYKAGILPEYVQADTVSNRIFCELCSVNDEANSKPVRNIYVWHLECEGKNGKMTIQVDSEYHKIYSVVLETPKREGEDDAWNGIWHEMLNKQAPHLAAGWKKYWQLSVPIIEDPVYISDYDDSKFDASSAAGKARSLMQIIYFNMKSGYQITLHYNLSFYADWNLQTGLLL